VGLHEKYSWLHYWEQTVSWIQAKILEHIARGGKGLERNTLLFLTFQIFHTTKPSNIFQILFRMGLLKAVDPHCSRLVIIFSMFLFVFLMICAT
jgi:hypothetical protein